MPLSNLCDICKQIDDSKAGFRRFELDQGGMALDSAFQRSSTPLLCLGKVRDIHDRQAECDLCRLIVTHGGLELEQDQGALCELLDDWFCQFDVLDRSSLKIRHTITGLIVRLNANLVGDVYEGPNLPWKALSDVPSKEMSTILELLPCNDITSNDSSDFRRVVRKVGDSISFQVVNGWISQCGKHHVRCMQNFEDTQNVSAPPITLIDVIEMRLVQAPPRARYVALSYVWGASTTKIDNVLSQGLDLFMGTALLGLDLPTTITDAMEVVRLVGLRYLWVDALCIPQNDMKAKQEQIAKMDLIYKQAYLAIVAAAGEDAAHGLPGVRRNTRTSAQDCIQFSDTTMVTSIDGRNYPGLNGSRWQSRAWTLQEDIFSYRRLVWTEKQVYWACQEARWSEEYALEYFPGSKVTYEFHCEPASNFMRKEEAPESSRLWLLRDQMRYIAIRNAFFERQLTRPVDMLNAFAGVLRAISDEDATAFILGLPEVSFSASLLWILLDRPRNHAGMPTQFADGSFGSVLFPSWSWAAWQLPVKAHSQFWSTSEDFTAATPVLTFYRASIDGRWAKISEAPKIEVKPSTLQDKWLMHPLEAMCPILSLIDEKWVDSGVLRFWTSTSKAYITAECQRERLMGPYHDAFRNRTYLERTEFKLVSRVENI